MDSLDETTGGRVIAELGDRMIKRRSVAFAANYAD